MTNLPKCKYCGKFLNPAKDESIICEEVYGFLGVDDIIYYHSKCKQTTKLNLIEVNSELSAPGQTLQLPTDY